MFRTDSRTHHRQILNNAKHLHLHALLPVVQRVILLDVGMVVQVDLSELWSSAIQSGHFMAAPVQVYHRSNEKTLKKVSELYEAKRGKPFDCVGHFSFDAMMIDLQAWQTLSKTSDVQFWLYALDKMFSSNELMSTGPDLLTTLVSCHQWTPLDARWSVFELGNSNDARIASDSTVTEASLLHRSISSKFRSKITSEFEQIWRQYSRPQCSGHGMCLAEQCLCEADYTGKTCQVKTTPISTITPGWYLSLTFNY